MKAQLALEFVYAIGTALVITTILIVGIGMKLEDVRREKEAFLLVDLASTARSELFVAAEAEDGYQRSFFMPYNLSGADYSVATANATIIFTTGEHEQVVKVPAVMGVLVKGSNVIRKSGGVVHLN